MTTTTTPSSSVPPPAPALAPVPSSSSLASASPAADNSSSTLDAPAPVVQSAKSNNSKAGRGPAVVPTVVLDNGARQVPHFFELCQLDDLIALIASMLDRLIEHNDRIPLTPTGLTRFHSRAPPSINVKDYLVRIARYTNVEPVCLLILLHYVDKVCTRLPTFTISSLTVHRFVIAAVSCGSKALSDSFCTNGRYARVGGIGVAEMNLLEKEFCEAIDWRLTTSGTVLAHYYTSLVRSHPGYALAPTPDSVIPNVHSSSSSSLSSMSPSSTSSSSSSHPHPHPHQYHSSPSRVMETDMDVDSPTSPHPPPPLPPPPTSSSSPPPPSPPPPSHSTSDEATRARPRPTSSTSASSASGTTTTTTTGTGTGTGMTRSWSPALIPPSRLRDRDNGVYHTARSNLPSPVGRPPVPVPTVPVPTVPTVPLE